MAKQYTVLFVDDEESILSALRRGLYEEDYRCLFATGGQAALDLMAKESVSVIVSDMRMPGMDGLRLLKIVKEQYPRTVRIVLSGYTQLQQVLTTINQAGIFKFITKPWMLEEELKVVIQEALDYYRLQERKDELELAVRTQNLAYQNMLKRLDVVMENASRQASLYGSIAAGMLFHWMEKHPQVPGDKETNDALTAIAILTRTLSGATISEMTDRTDTDVALLFLQAFRTEPGFKVPDPALSPPSLTIRLHPELLSACAHAIAATISPLLSSCVVMMTQKTETSEKRAWLHLNILVAPTQADTGKVDESSLPLSDAIVESIQLAIDRIARHMDGQFACRWADAGLLCQLRLPAKS